MFIRSLLFRLRVNGLPPLCSPNPLPPTFPLSLVKHRIQDEGFGHFCDHFAQFSWVFPMSCCSVPKLCRAVCHPMNCSTPDSSVLYYLPEFAQPHIPCLHVIQFLFYFLLFMSIQFSEQSEEPRRLKENSFLPDQIMYLSKFGGGGGGNATRNWMFRISLIITGEYISPWESHQLLSKILLKIIQRSLLLRVSLCLKH